MRFCEIQITDRGFTGQDRGTPFSAPFALFLIHEAWGQVDYEDLADGFGPGEGTHGDWSAIRDSSDGAKAAMFERAINHLFGRTCDCGFAYIDPHGAQHTAECATHGGVRGHA